MVKVGTCGWSARGGRKAYFKFFNVVELQSTFYRVPRESTVVKWRNDSPPDFDFTVKAWQAITHPPSSPTWRRSGVVVPPELADRYGFFRPTDEVYEAWKLVRRVCELLRAEVCIFQTPPSFGYSEENAMNVELFFSTISRGSLKLGWEPRGTWSEHPVELKRLLAKMDLTHVVDPLRRRPLYNAGYAYFRLHGLGGREVNYRYKYTDDDLRRLLSIVREFEELSEVYVMFNNMYMFDDALRFKRLLASY